jgi:predicted lipase
MSSQSLPPCQLSQVQARKPRKVVISGHSLGGAVSKIMAAMLRVKMPSLDIITVNFGGPTTGNQEFAAWYNANVGAPI